MFSSAVQRTVRLSFPAQNGIPWQFHSRTGEWQISTHAAGIGCLVVGCTPLEWVKRPVCRSFQMNTLGKAASHFLLRRLLEKFDGVLRTHPFTQGMDEPPAEAVAAADPIHEPDAIVFRQIPFASGIKHTCPVVFARAYGPSQGDRYGFASKTLR